MTDPRSGIVLLHGISRTNRSMRRMEAALRREGYATLNLEYASRTKPLQHLAEDIHPRVMRFIASTPGDVHVVAHSMGGLLAQVYLARHPQPRIRRVVMLGTPNGGSEIADRLRRLALYRAWFGPAGQQLVTRRDRATSALFHPLPQEIGVIAGNRGLDPLAWALLPKPNDGRVSVANTMLAGQVDHLVIDTTHPGLVLHPRAVAQTIWFLREGRFVR